MLGGMFLWLVANLKQGVIYFIKQALPPKQISRECIESKILILFFSLFKVHMKRGVFEAVFVDALEPIAVTNIKKAVVATLNMDLSASR